MLPIHPLLAAAALALASWSPSQTAGPGPIADAETLRHFRALVQFDTIDPGSEKPLVDYLKGVLEAEGIEVKTFAKEPGRPNLVARLRGSGEKKPLLMMGHADTASIDPSKWTFPAFSAARDSGYIYGRGTIDDKDNVTAGLMTLLTLKRRKVPLDRDVIFMAEAGEEGSMQVGILPMANENFPAIEAEYCFAEGANGIRANGELRFITVQTTEKVPRQIDLMARGASGHASIPLKTNPVVHLATAIGRIGAWRPEIRLNSTTRAYFERMAAISPGALAERYRAVLSPDPKVVALADAWFYESEPRHASMLRTSVSPTIMNGGYRFNVIPSEAKATLDVRALPDEDPVAFLETLRGIVNDPAVEVKYTSPDARPTSPPTRLDTEGFAAIEAAVKKEYGVTAVPMMGTSATDMAYLRARGIQCFGIGPVIDSEDGPKGFGAHSDQERIAEEELYRFVRFQYAIIESLARAR